MGIILMFAGLLFFALGLALAFSERYGKKANSAAPVLLIISIVLLCSGVVIKKDGDFSIPTYTTKQPGTAKSDNSKGLGGGAESPSDKKGKGQGNSTEGEDGTGTGEKGEQPKGWANGLGGSFEKWKDIFGPPDQVELINNTGTASFLDRYINADFTDGKVTSFSLDLQKIDSSGLKLYEAKKEVDQMIPFDSELLGKKELDADKIFTERYRSEIMKKDFMETDLLDTSGESADKKPLKPEEFNVIYHKLDNGNIYKVHVKTEAESKSEE